MRRRSWTVATRGEVLVRMMPITITRAPAMDTNWVSELKPPPKMSAAAPARETSQPATRNFAAMDIPAPF
jgi:hypothetical protein